jgi:hypothetical protein
MTQIVNEALAVLLVGGVVGWLVWLSTPSKDGIKQATTLIWDRYAAKSDEDRAALALVQVDQPISAELLKKIAALKGVVQAKLLSF